MRRGRKGRAAWRPRREWRNSVYRKTGRARARYSLSSGCRGAEGST